MKEKEREREKTRERREGTERVDSLMCAEHVTNDTFVSQCQVESMSGDVDGTREEQAGPGDYDVTEE